MLQRLLTTTPSNARPSQQKVRLDVKVSYLSDKSNPEPEEPVVHSQLGGGWFEGEGVMESDDDDMDR